MFYVTGFIFLWGWLSFSFRGFDSQIAFELPEWCYLVGIILMIAGSALSLSCIVLFSFRGKGTPAPFDPPLEFVAAGPYKYVRNPMYIGGFIVLLGLGFFEKSISMIAFSFIALFIAHVFVFFYEEPALTKRFEGSYLGYKRKVNRWLPIKRKQD